MSAKKKSGRPKNIRTETCMLPAHDDPLGPLGTLDARKADPFNRMGTMTNFYAPILGGADMDSNWFKRGGIHAMLFFRDAPIETLKDYFNQLLTLRREYDLPDDERPVRVRVLIAYGEFLKEHGHVPTKRRMKRYLLEESGVKGLPGKEKTREWGRLWKDSHLDGLPSRSLE